MYHFESIPSIIKYSYVIKCNFKSIMANGVVRDNKLKRPLEDDNESRSVKRRTTHELHENGNKRIDIGSSLMNAAERKLFLEILQVCRIFTDCNRIFFTEKKLMVESSRKEIQCACVWAVRSEIAESVKRQVHHSSIHSLKERN